MRKQLDELSPSDALGLVGDLIDDATDKALPEQAQQALEYCDVLEKRLDATQRVELDYFRANAWSVIRRANHRDESAVWEWDQPEILNEVYCLRSAVRATEFSSLDTFRQCQMLVNLGNILNHIGRPIEAFEYWRRALTIIPKFGMAAGNLGLGYEVYAKSLYDRGHAVIILKAAYDLLVTTEGKDIVWDGLGFKSIQQQMLGRASLIDQHIDINKVASISLDGFSLGKSKTEEEYRCWVLENYLFLNPLNDIGLHTIATQDVLHLPDIVTKIGEPPSLIGFYNQLKQEYISARYVLWQGALTAGQYKQHFSDNDVHLTNTLDYPIYGISIEKIKFAFRSGYSLFDKIAFFINHYWNLEIPADRVNFHSVWTEKKGNKKQLRQVFWRNPNLSLRGLYWLSKEFSDKEINQEISLGRVMEPDAEHLRIIRNHLEHKYLKIHDDIWSYGKDYESSHFSDNLAYHLTLTEMTDKTLRLMKRVREALVYLSLAVHREEQLRAKKRTDMAIPITLPKWE